MRFASLAIASLLSVAACVSTPSPQQELTERLTATLGRQLAARQASIQQTPGGATVVLSNATLFDPKTGQLDEQGTLALASVVEGVFDAQRTTVGIAATSDAMTPDSATVASTRSQSVMSYFESVGFGPNSLVRSNPSAGVGRTTLDIQLQSEART